MTTIKPLDRLLDWTAVLLLLENRADIKKAQATLEATIKKELSQKIIKRIGWAGGGISDARLWSNGEYWFWSADHDYQDKIPRRLNWFGRVSDGTGVTIAVEINTPYEGREGRVAGFFAKHTETGQIYLFHSAQVGGGGKGVKKDALVAWANLSLMPVFSSDGTMREGILVMPIKGGVGSTRSAMAYVQSIIEFKAAVKSGEASSFAFKAKEKLLSDYYDEFFGRKKGRIKGKEIDYLSRHGEIVKELSFWRALNGMPSGYKIVKSGMLDLGVSSKRNLIEAYEVKTSARRTDIYTGIGQLCVHATSTDCEKTLVLPVDERLAPDLKDALNRNGIKLLHYKLTEKDVRILKP